MLQLGYKQVAVASKVKNHPQRKIYWCFCKKKLDQHVVPATLCNHILISQLQAKVEAYKTLLKLQTDSDETPLKEWKNHCTVYPVLAKLSRKYFCMCATMQLYLRMAV